MSSLRRQERLRNAAVIARTVQAAHSLLSLLWFRRAGVLVPPYRRTAPSLVSPTRPAVDAV